MKRIILLAITISCSLCCFPQQFKVTYEAAMRTKEHRQESCGSQNRIEVTTTLTPGTIAISGGTSFVDYLSGSINDGVWWKPTPRIYIFEGSNPISKIQINGYHWDNPTWESCKQRGASTASTVYTETDFPCVIRKLSDFFGGYDNGSYLNVTIEPVTGTTPLTFITNDTQIFPTDDTITIRSNVLYSNYEWEYSLNGGSYQTNSGKFGYNQTFTLSAKDLLGVNYLDYVNKNISFRAKYLCNNAYTQIITIPIRLSAPHIETVDYEMPQCHGEANAQLKIKFDRALYDKEKLFITYNEDGNMNIKEELFIDPVTLVAQVGGFSARSYDIGLYGTHRFGTNLQDTVNTYIGDARHQYSVTIPERPVVSYAIWQDSVHCQAGQDGKIWINATGGVGKYDAALLEAGNAAILQQLTALEGIPISFNNLTAGNYTVQLTDTNGCVPPVNPVQSIEVFEPEKPLQIHNIAYQEPLGFGLSNGKAGAYIDGGTGTYTVKWTDASGNVLSSEPLISKGTSQYSEVRGLKKGAYYIEVSDQNYPLVNPKTDANECGCMAADSIVVDEPPRLEVAIEEKHYVTCNGDNDGVLAAHAIGGRPDHSRLFPYEYQWYRLSKDSVLLETYTKNDSILSELYSGYYVICATDTNGIQATSKLFHLVQPDPLTVTAQVLRHVLCDGDDTGQIEVMVTGGTQPYSYFWETGDTTRVVSGLQKGIYSVYVRDARYRDNPNHYCSEDANAEIISPNGMTLTATLTDPTCNAYFDGKIDLVLVGGVAPYSYGWSDGATTKNRSNLSEGDYQITVTDANGCHITEAYSLHQPDALVVNLGGDFTLCKDRSFTLNGSIGIENISYQWTKDGTVIASDSVYTISAAGIYRLTATNTIGCSAYDEITVGQSNDELITDFVVASKIPNNTKVYAVNIIRTGYDRIEWIVPDEAIVSEESDDRIQFSLTKNGSYSLGMIAYKGLCNDILYKTIEVVNKEDIEDYDDSEPFVKRFMVYPNPNDGHFSVWLELREAGDYALYLYNNSGVLIETKTFSDSVGGEILFNQSSAGAGVYHLRFVSKETTSVFKIIIH
jgi:hypothetical protein